MACPYQGHTREHHWPLATCFLESAAHETFLGTKQDVEDIVEAVAKLQAKAAMV